MADPNLPVGTEIRSGHGTIWVKTGPDEWKARGNWGVIDDWSVYHDMEVHGEEVRW